MTDEHSIQVIGFHNASDEQAEVINAVMMSGNFACVTLIRGESGEWLGWACRQGDEESLLYFAIDDGGPPLLQAALDGLMRILDDGDPGDIVVTSTIRAVVVDE